MKIGFILSMLLTYSLTSAQDNILKMLHKARLELVPFTDSIVNKINSRSDLQVKSDTSHIYDANDIDKFLGYFIETLYFDQDQKLKKAMLTTPARDSSEYFFNDTLLIKVNVFTRKPQKKITYYYSPYDNDLESPLIYRIISKYPPAEEQFRNLEVGKSYIKQYIRR